MQFYSYYAYNLKIYIYKSIMQQQFATLDTLSDSLLWDVIYAE